MTKRKTKPTTIALPPPAVEHETNTTRFTGLDPEFGLMLFDPQTNWIERAQYGVNGMTAVLSLRGGDVPILSTPEGDVLVAEGDVLVRSPSGVIRIKGDA